MSIVEETLFYEDIQSFSQRWFSVTLADHQLEWLWFIHSNQWVMLLAPRGHGKTTIIVIYITWLICNDPSIRVLLGMHKEEDANERARAIQIVLELPEVQEEYGLELGKPPQDKTFDELTHKLQELSESGNKGKKL